MSKKVLILKNAGATLFQQPDDKRPSALELGRTLFGGRGTGKLNRLAAAAGLAGKGAALGGTAVQTAHQMQGGNLFAPLSAGYTYEGLDPSGKFLAGRVKAGQEGAEKFQSQQNQIPQSTPTQRMSGYTTGSNPNQVGVRAKGPANVRVPLPGHVQPAKPEWMNTTSPQNQPLPAPPIPAMPPQPAVPQPAFQPPPVTQPLSPAGMAESYTGQQNPSGTVVPSHQPATITNDNIIDAATGLNLRIKSPTDIVPNANAMLQAQVYPPEPSGVQTKLNRINPQAIAAQPAQSPMDQAMASLRTNAQMPTYQQGATAPTSTANPLSQPDMNNANSVLDSYYNTLSPDQQAQGGAVQGAIASQGNFGTNPETWGQPKDQSLGNTVNWNQWSDNMPKDMWKAMLKAYVKKLYDEFGGYLYKMTPHEAGQFAVYTLFTLRK
jgi:hypothetical protein